jgi:hypothetical protein
MGGGVQQLLMVATSLFTTPPGGGLFLEEPESNLHPGAQRYLIEQLLGSGRQVFIATHSPLFVNLGEKAPIFRVTRAGGRTSVERVSEPAQLAATLEDIGARNSDVLLSDGVLLVEGDTERDCFLAWGEILGHSLTRSNVTVLPMGGGAHVARGAPARSQVLEKISRKTAIPHLFLVDSDERSDAEVERLKKNDKVCVLSGRELENLFLRPALIRRRFLEKYEHAESIRANLEGVDNATLAATIDEEAGKLFGLVLLKRIKAELGGLAEGLLPREEVARLAVEADNPDLPALVEKAVKTGFADHLAGLDVQNLVVVQKERLRKEWVKPEDRLKLAPGEEVLGAVFKRYGGKFNKRRDGPEMAKLMTAAEVPAEIKDVIEALLAQLPG